MRIISAERYEKIIRDTRDREYADYVFLQGKRKSLDRHNHGTHVEFCNKILEAMMCDPGVEAVPVQIIKERIVYLRKQAEVFRSDKQFFDGGECDARADELENMIASIKNDAIGIEEIGGKDE